MTCPSCNTVNYGSSTREDCGRCGLSLARGEVREIDEWEKIPAGLCKECEEKQKACDKMVKEGGIYFRCKKCGSEGSITAEHELSKAVRKKMNIPIPGKVGVELEDCPSCQEEKTA